MTPEYLIFANFILATRLVYLTNDTALPRTANLALSGAQLLGVLLLFTLNATAATTLATVALIGLLNAFLEPRLDLRKGHRLITLGLLLLLPSYAGSFGTGLGFRETVEALAAHIGQHIPLLQFPAGTGVAEALLITLGALLLANETNILVRAVFHHCQLEPQSNEASNSPIDASEYKAGRIIGFLERWLMYLIILMSNNFSALAFIIAAKGLARMKQMENKQFAEYMLIGTLVSVLSAVAIGGWIASMPQ